MPDAWVTTVLRLIDLPVADDRAGEFGEAIEAAADEHRALRLAVTDPALAPSTAFDPRWD